MDQEKQRAIASKGGKAAHLKGTAHEFTSEEARIAGSKGGRAARQKSAKRRFDLKAVQTNADGAQSYGFGKNSGESPEDGSQETQVNRGARSQSPDTSRDIAGDLNSAFDYLPEHKNTGTV